MAGSAMPEQRITGADLRMDALVLTAYRRQHLKGASAASREVRESQLGRRDGARSRISASLQVRWASCIRRC